MTNPTGNTGGLPNNNTGGDFEDSSGLGDHDEAEGSPGGGAMPGGTGASPGAGMTSGAGGAIPDGTGTSADGGAGKGGGDATGEVDPFPQPGQLTAGEWKDNANWPWMVELMGQHKVWRQHAQAWELDPLKSCAVFLTRESAPIKDATVILRDAQAQEIWTAKTDRQGKALLVNGLFHSNPADTELSLEIRYADQTTTIQNFACTSPDQVSPTKVDLPAPVAAPKSLDLMFSIDTTGSMSDELRYLQAELNDVISQVRNQHANAVDIRLSVNFYRDLQDEYVVRPFPFTTDIPAALRQLGAQHTGGGGDFPEAVDLALENAIHEHQWRAQATSKLMFLVLDAPPHATPEARNKVYHAVKTAAAQGIQIIPVVSSGIDKSAEVLLRSALSVATNSTYVFLTNHSGIGGNHIEPTIGPYEVEKLNALLTRLISESLQAPGS